MDSADNVELENLQLNGPNPDETTPPICFGREGILPTCGSLFEVSLSDSTMMEDTDLQTYHLNHSGIWNMPQHVSIILRSKLDDKKRYLVNDVNTLYHFYLLRERYLKNIEADVNETVETWNKAFSQMERPSLRFDPLPFVRVCVDSMHFFSQRKSIERDRVIDLRRTLNGQRTAFLQLLCTYIFMSSKISRFIIVFNACRQHLQLQSQHARSQPCHHSPREPDDPAEDFLSRSQVRGRKEQGLLGGY